MASFRAINAPEWIGSARGNASGSTAEYVYHDPDVTEMHGTISMIPEWDMQDSGSPLGKGAHATNSSTTNVDHLNGLNAYGDSGSPIMHENQQSQNAGGDFIVANQEYDWYHNSPFAYDRETRHVTYHGINEALYCLDDTAVPDGALGSRDPQSDMQSHLQGHYGGSDHDSGNEDQQHWDCNDASQVYLHHANTMHDQDDSAGDGQWTDPAESMGEAMPVQDEIPSLVQDARDEGLCHDYLTDDPFKPFRLPTPPLAPIDDIPEPCLKAASDIVHNPGSLEKWEVDKDSAAFLASLMALGRDEGASLQGLKDHHQNFNDLGTVEPLLRRDPEQELQSLKLKNAVTVSTHGLQLFRLDVEKDETLDWPTQAGELPRQKDVDARTEKLEVDRGVVLYLKELMDLPALDMRGAFQICIEQDKPRPLAGPMTPPLLPLSPAREPSPLPESLQQMQLTSSPEDLIAKDLQELDKSIRRMDEAPDAGSEMTLGPGHDILLHMEIHTSDDKLTSPPKRRRISELEAEVPLLAQSSPDPNTPRVLRDKAKIVAFAPEVQSFIPEPDADIDIFDPDFAEKDLQAYINDELMPFAEAINESARNENLVEFDTTIRLAEPPVPSNEPVAPWTSYTNVDAISTQLEAQRALMGYTKRELLRRETHWAGVSKLERALPWTPFPARLGKAYVAEELDDDKSAARYMTELDFEGEIDISSLVAKAGGLRLLDPTDSDDEDLESAHFDDEESGVQYEEPPSVAKTEQAPRRSEAQQELTPKLPVVAPARNMPFLAPAHPIQDGSTQAQRAPPVQAPSNEIAQSAKPSHSALSTLLLKRKLELDKDSKEDARATGRKLFKPSRVSDLIEPGGLAGFMGLQGIQADNGVRPTHQKPQPVRAPAPAAVMVAPAGSTPLLAPQTPLPSPPLVEPTRPMQVVVSTQVVSNRTLVRELQSMLRNLDMVERDTVPAASSHEKGDKASASTEADITLSPAAGLVMTTLQKLKQRGLPGQTSFVGIRDRVHKVALHYERLTILVNEGRQLEPGGQNSATALDPRDCDALADFMAFTSALDSDVDVRYAPGSEHDLTKWIAASISQCAIFSNDGGMKLLADETLWERFLRTAGMNAFAAQFVLSQLKAPVATNGSEACSIVSKSAPKGEVGLAAFVSMSAEERVLRFGQVLGGQRVLSRVARAIDGPWTSKGGSKRG